MTYYCRVHVDWEGTDLGKIHDHIEKEHAEDLKPASTIPEYFRLMKNMVASKIYEIPGPNRLSDTQWIARYAGRMPKMASQIATNDQEK
jgi:hypothetical protein